VHAMFFTPAADQMRAFIRDKLGFPFTDTGGGWLIFDAPEAEIGCHEAQTTFHRLSFYCDDLPGTVAALEQRGVEFTSPVQREDWGLVTRFRVPGGDEVELYQPMDTKHRAHAVARATKRKRARTARSGRRR